MPAAFGGKNHEKGSPENADKKPLRVFLHAFGGLLIVDGRRPKHSRYNFKTNG